MRKIIIIVTLLAISAGPDFLATEINNCNSTGNYTYEIDGVVYSCSDHLLTKETTYYPNGNKAKQAYYENNLLNKVYEYYDNQNNTIKARTTYEDGLISELQRYDENYNRTDNYIYENGNLDVYYKYDGNAYQRTNYYTDGVTVKESAHYDENGKRTYADQYDENGLLTSKTEYKTDGSYTKSSYYQNSTRKKEYIKYNASGKRTEATKYNTSGQKTEYRKYSNGVTNVLYLYHSNGKVKSRTDYNQSGNKTKITSYKSNGDNDVTMYYSNSGKKTQSDKYINDIRRFKYIYNPDNSYTKAFYNRQGVKEKTEYFNKSGSKYKIVNHLKTGKDKGYTTKKVSACNLSGKRYKNTVVDIGFDSKFANRTYYGYTNKYGQLVKVEAAQLIPQSETYEKVVWASNGKGKEKRYCKDEANVKGISKKYDQGHVIADSWGGAGNAYNITPEYEWVNLYGGQYKMENDFRNAGKKGYTITNFEMKITYKNGKTNIPYKYTAKYKIDGKNYSRSFYNRKA